MEIYLNDLNGNSIAIEANNVKNYYGSDYPKKNCTLILFKDGSEIRVSDDFDTVDILVEKHKENNIEN